MLSQNANGVWLKRERGSTLIKQYYFYLWYYLLCSWWWSQILRNQEMDKAWPKKNKTKIKVLRPLKVARSSESTSKGKWIISDVQYRFQLIKLQLTNLLKGTSNLNGTCKHHSSTKDSLQWTRVVGFNSRLHYNMFLIIAVVADYKK